MKEYGTEGVDNIPATIAERLNAWAATGFELVTTIQQRENNRFVTLVFVRERAE
jgi:alkanesulfonate monooxygenase SsuD/methylene tetrahydromethanopterin reductase-like flavin-dependent oxidoreductase (luciferase family)